MGLFSKRDFDLWRTGELDLYHFDADRFESSKFMPCSLRSLGTVYSRQDLSSKSWQVDFLLLFLLFYLHSSSFCLSSWIFVKVEPAIKNGHQLVYLDLLTRAVGMIITQNVRWCLSTSHSEFLRYALYADSSSQVGRLIVLNVLMRIITLFLSGRIIDMLYVSC